MSHERPDRPPVVRLATPADIEALADTLADAFLGYAWTDWAIPEDDRRGRVRELHRLFAGLVGVATGTTWVTHDLAAVAQWIPPAGFAVPPELRTLLAHEEPALFGDRLERVDALDARTRGQRPREPHWWLATVGTRPEQRRRGLARAVLTPVLERCDRDGVLAALETSSEGTVAFYERLGFRITVADRSPDGALPVWVMVRDPIRR